MIRYLQVHRHLRHLCWWHFIQLGVDKLSSSFLGALLSLSEAHSTRRSSKMEPPCYFIKY